MKGLKRQVSPGVAVLLVIIVLAIVQFVWWRGLVYRPPGPTPPRSGPPPPPPESHELIIKGLKDIQVDTLAGDLPPGDTDGPGYDARFDRPTGLAYDASTNILYVCDSGNHRIRAISADGVVTTVSGGDQGYADGPAATAQFCAPSAICLGAHPKELFVADTGNGCIRRIRDGVVTTCIRAPELAKPCSIQLAQGDGANKAAAETLVACDAVTHNMVTCHVGSTGNGSVTLLKLHSVSAVVSGAELGRPGGVTVPPLSITGKSDGDTPHPPLVKQISGWCAVGKAALITDPDHAGVFLQSDGVAQLIAGVVSSNRTIKDYRDGTGETATFSDLTGIATDNRHFAFVCDTESNCVRRLTLPDYLFH